MNYHTDHRVIAGQSGSWYESIDTQRMTAIASFIDEDEPREIPFKWEVCGTCEGRGRHVSPSIDCNGISGETFREDPDFHQDYMNGLYDVPCAECNGRRVVPEPALEEHVEAFEAWVESELDYQRICAAERRMGA